MKVERLVLSLSLLSVGCSKLNAAFAEDAEGSAGASDTAATDSKGTDGSGPDSSNPTVDSDSNSTQPTDPNPPESTTSGPPPTDSDPSNSDPSDSAPTDSSTSAAEATGLGESGETGADACPAASGQCFPLLDNCGQGERCRPYDSDDNGSFDAFGCFETPKSITGNGGICEHVCGPFGGIDSCAASRLCDPLSDNPTCVPLCHVEDGCAVGTCVTDDLPGNNYGLCRTECDPLLQDCPGEQLCALVAEGGICVEATEDSPQGMACGALNECAAGLACVSGDFLSECDDLGCCTSICSVSDGDCPGALFCENFYPPESTANTDVGVCVDDE